MNTPTPSPEDVEREELMRTIQRTNSVCRTYSTKGCDTDGVCNCRLETDALIAAGYRKLAPSAVEVQIAEIAQRHYDEEKRRQGQEGNWPPTQSHRDRATLLRDNTALREELRLLREKAGAARTAGTREICNECGKSTRYRASCNHGDCPLRPASTVGEK